MNNVTIVENAIKKIPINKIFKASETYILLEGITELNYFKILGRMAQKDQIKKASKGCYYRPSKTKYGNKAMSEAEILNKYIRNHKNGFEIGYGLYNELGLTTQIPIKREFVCNTIEGKQKKVNNLYLYKYQIKLNSDSKNTIEFLEVLQNYSKIEDLNNEVFLSYSKNYCVNYEEHIVDEIIARVNYKKSTLAFLKEILDFNQISNKIGKYLSTLSKYNIPNWRDSYESTS